MSYDEYVSYVCIILVGLLEYPFAYYDETNCICYLAIDCLCLED